MFTGSMFTTSSYESRFHKDLTLWKVRLTTSDNHRNSVCSKGGFTTEREAVEYAKQCIKEHRSFVKPLADSIGFRTPSI